MIGVTVLFVMLASTSEKQMAEVPPLERVDRVRWEMMAYAPDGSVMCSLDKTRLTNSHVVWLRWDYAEVQTETDLPKYDESIQKTEIDCHAERWRILSIVSYLSGKVVSSFVYPKTEWRDVVPESIGELAYDNVCDALRATSKKRKN